MSLDKPRRVGKGVSHDGPKQQPLYLSILLDWLHWTSLNSASHTDSFTSQLWIVKPQRMLLMSNSVPVLHLPPKASRSCCLSHTKPPRHAAKTPQEKCRDRQHRLLGKAIVPSYTRWAKISGRVSPSSPQLWSLLEAETACCGGQKSVSLRRRYSKWMFEFNSDKASNSIELLLSTGRGQSAMSQLLRSGCSSNIRCCEMDNNAKRRHRPEKFDSHPHLLLQTIYIWLIWLWLWINIYKHIVKYYKMLYELYAWMNIHIPAILMFTDTGCWLIPTLMRKFFPS